MKIAFITAGAAGMYCGSCMKDNTLAAALGRLGHDALLIPTYTPIRTDEDDVSQQRVFFGGINVYLQQKSGLFRHTPLALRPAARHSPAAALGVAVRAEDADRSLGELTVSMLQGRDGKQRKEVRKLVDWLANDFRPDVVHPDQRAAVRARARVEGGWTGRSSGPSRGTTSSSKRCLRTTGPRCIELIRKNCESVEGYIATSRYYADFMAGYLGLPRERMHVVYPGINLKGHGGPREFRERPPYTIGYFARICPEKGFHNIVEAFSHPRQTPGAPACRLRVSGWLGENYRPYFDEQLLQSCGRRARRARSSMSTARRTRTRCGSSSRIDVLSVPTIYREPKGIYVLEALANGVPVVQPRHGAFPELIEATGGGLLVEPGRPGGTARKDCAGCSKTDLRRRLGEDGQEGGLRPVHGRDDGPGDRGGARPVSSSAGRPRILPRRSRREPAVPHHRRIEFGDTDMAGIAHFANFFRYMEAAETEFLRSHGLTVSWREGSERFGFPRVSVACDFQRPVRFEDVLDIAVTVEEVGRKSVRYRFDFSRDGKEIAVGRITAVYCRATPDHGFESAEIPPAIRDKLAGE